MCAEQVPASLGRMRYDEEAAGAQPQASATALYLWRPPNRAAVSVKVQSRWGNLYEASAAIRSLAVNINGQAQVTADITTPEDGPVADRLPGRTIRLRVGNLPAPPYRVWCPVLISLGELADLVTARVTLIQPPAARAEMRVLISAAVPGAVFALDRRRATRPPNVVARAVRLVDLLVDATAPLVTC